MGIHVPKFVKDAAKGTLGEVGNVIHEAHDIVHGTPSSLLEFGKAQVHDAIHTGGMSLINPFSVFADRKNSETYKKIIVPQAKYYDERYVQPYQKHGLGGGTKIILKEFQQKPVSGALDVISVVDPALKAGTFLKAEGTVGERLAAVRGYSGEGRSLAVKGSRGETLGNVRLQTAPGPTARLIQRAFDQLSETFPSARGIGSNTRAARAQAKTFLREQRRTEARMASGAEKISKPAGAFHTIKNGPLRVRLYWEAQLAAGAGEEGLRALLQNLKERRAAPLPYPITKPTPQLLRAQTRVDRLNSQLDYAVNDGLGTTPAAHRLVGRLHEAQLELQRLQSAHLRRQSLTDVRQARLNLDLMEKRLAQGEQRARTTGRTPKWLDEARSQVETQRTQVAQLEEQRTMASTVRARGLDKMISELEQAIKAKPGKGYDQALAAAKTMTQERERILIDAGLLTPEEAAARRALLPQDLGLDGQADVHVPHRSKHIVKSTQGGFVRGRLGGGPASKTGLGVGKENNLALLNQGRLLTDPNLVVESWFRAQVFEFHNLVKRWLGSVGEPIDPVAGPKPGWYVVNPDGKALPAHWADAIDTATPQEVEHSLTDYVRRYVGKAGESDQALKDAEGHYLPGVVQVDPRIAENFFNSLVGPGTATQLGLVGKSIDLVNGLIKTSLLYANPGFIPANLVGTMAFAALHQGAWLPVNLMKAGRILTRDPELSRLIQAEVGQGASLALATEKQGGLGGVLTAVKTGEQKLASVSGHASDTWGRAAAWVHEARKAGFRTREQMMKLLTADDPKTAAMRDAVWQRANDAMVNFDRLGPVEKAIASRMLFVWPWVRGSLAWAGYFPLNYPVRSALLSHQAEYESAHNQKLLGNLPSYLQDAFPLGVGGGVARVINPAAENPLGTLGQFIGMAQGTSHLADLLNPIIPAAYDTAKGENQYGTKESTPAAAKDNFGSLMPGVNTTKALIEGGRKTKVYGKENRTDIVKRSILRVAPVDINLKAAHAAAAKENHHTQTLAEKKAVWLARAKHLTKAYGYTIPKQILTIVDDRYAYYEAKAKAKKDAGVTKLSEYQDLGVLLQVAFERHPEWAQYKAEAFSAYKQIHGNADSVHAMYLRTEKMLGFSTLEAFNRELTKAERALHSKKGAPAKAGS